jgi:thioredoxin-related protein
MQAADFPFTDTRGKLRTLHGVKAEYTLLIFANPGCNACQEITAAMKASPAISALVDSGRLKVVDVYIDQEIDDWKAHIADYPADWINGYDQDYSIRTDLVYNIRAIPSIYLLDKDKTVLMKDAPQEKVLGALERL